MEEARHDRLRNKIGVSTINALQQQSASHQLDIYWCRINTYESVPSGMLILNYNSSTLVLTQLPRNALCDRLFPVAAFVRKFMLKKIGFPQWLLLLHTQPLWKPCNPAFNIGYFLSSSLVPLYICCQTLWPYVTRTCGGTDNLIAWYRLPETPSLHGHLPLLASFNSLPYININLLPQNMGIINRTPISK